MVAGGRRKEEVEQQPLSYRARGGESTVVSQRSLNTRRFSAACHSRASSFPAGRLEVAAQLCQEKQVGARTPIPKPLGTTHQDATATTHQALTRPVKKNCEALLSRTFHTFKHQYSAMKTWKSKVKPTSKRFISTHITVCKKISQHLLLILNDNSNFMG